MIDLAVARSAVLARATRRAAVPVDLTAAVGCVLAEDVRAAYSVPPFATTSVDGYAVLAADVAGAAPGAPARLTVRGTVFAGAGEERTVTPGTTWKIMTGAPVPAGADAVVMVEDSVAGDGDVELSRGVAPGANVRPAGSNVEGGALVFPAGTVLRAVHVGVLAGVGVRTVTVFGRPRVGVLVTGDELVTEARPLRAGEIYESNREMLLALVKDADCVAVDLGVVSDDVDLLRERLAAAARDCDAVITSGGVSMGDADPVKALLTGNADTQWMQIAIRPAKPFLLSVLDGGVPLLGLPGNPVSSLVSFELLVRPALRAMLGRGDVVGPGLPAVADESLVNVPGGGRTAYLRVRAAFGQDGRIHVRSVSGQDSHQLASSAAADGFVEIAPGESVEAGASVPFLQTARELPLR